LERQGWIATARCVEIRVDLPQADRLHCLSLTPREQIRVAYENPRKIAIARKLIEQHPNDQILIIGQYLTQLHNFAMEIDAPLITGQTPIKPRRIIRSIPPRRDKSPYPFTGREFRHRPSRRLRGHSNIGVLWLAPGRSPTLGTYS